jgi:predicted dinucleotide-binding enzyme
MTHSGGEALTVVVVGAGSVGSALAANLRRLGHRVRFARRSPEDDEVEIDGASVGADLTILAVPFGVVGDVVPRLGLSAGAVVVDATNPFGRPLPPGATSGAEVVAAATGAGVHVVKAFNVMGAEHLSDPALPGGSRPVLPVAADDDDARSMVVALARDMGFEAVPIRGLSNAALLEDAARYWGLLAMNGGLGREVVLVARRRRSDPAP